MAFRRFGKSLLYGLPLGITFLDCVGYVARVDGKFRSEYLKNDEWFIVLF